MSSEITQVFEVLLFGEGFWIGFILIAAFAIGLSYKYKYVGVIFEVVLFFMSLEYLENLAVSSNHLWGVILCYVLMIFLGWKLFDDAQSS